MRNTGKPPSEYLGITDPLTALRFDIAVAHRIYKYERDEREDLANRTAQAISRMLFGGDETAAPEIEGAASDLVAQDKFADANTTVW